MSNFQLKVIALISMTIDHAGYFLFDGVEAFRILGRLALPIFIFLMIEGYYKTSNLKKYILRLYLFAIVCQLPLFIFGIDTYINIFFLLATGLVMIKTLESSKKPFHIFIIIAFALATSYLDIDYSGYGILLFYIFYLFKKYNLSLTNKLLLYISLTILFEFSFIQQIFNYKSSIQFYSIFSLFIIEFYNGKLGYRSKRTQQLFYLYYPFHVIVLATIEKFSR